MLDTVSLPSPIKLLNNGSQRINISSGIPHYMEGKAEALVPDRGGIPRQRVHTALKINNVFILGFCLIISIKL